jgi:hypothetical protein
LAKFQSPRAITRPKIIGPEWNVNLICNLSLDLNFGIWVYNDELQIKFTFRSGPIIFGRVMALGLWNLAKYLVVTTYFSKSISQTIAKKSGDNCFISELRNWATHFVSRLDKNHPHFYYYFVISTSFCLHLTSCFGYVLDWPHQKAVIVYYCFDAVKLNR